MIPDLTDGVLPHGTHDCTLDELDEVFGQFQRSDRRMELTKKLRSYVEQVRRTAIATAVVVDGSFVTAKEEPNDIDVILVLKADFDLQQELRPFEYNVQSKRMVRNLFGFDLRIALDGSELYHEAVAFFSQVRVNDPEQTTRQTRKGLLRIAL
ncbi:MAG: hypothetical protein K2R98_29610 [Gemmataceae bacterium]|nr:hypothetical protein [Gemmataceae bacterium]